MPEKPERKLSRPTVHYVVLMIIAVAAIGPILYLCTAKEADDFYVTATWLIWGIGGAFTGYLLKFLIDTGRKAELREIKRLTEEIEHIRQAAAEFKHERVGIKEAGIEVEHERKEALKDLKGRLSECYDCITAHEEGASASEEFIQQMLVKYANLRASVRTTAAPYLAPDEGREIMEGTLEVFAEAVDTIDRQKDKFLDRQGLERRLNYSLAWIDSHLGIKPGKEAEEKEEQPPTVS